MKKLLIFDVDGVLEKEEIIIEARTNAQIAKIAGKLRISKEEASRKYYKTKKSLGTDPSSVNVFMKFGFTRKKFFNLLDEVDPKGLIELHENCEEMLKKASKDNIIVTFSNTPRKSTCRTLKILKIGKYVNKIYSSEDFTESKPSTKNLKAILKDNGFEPKDAVAIGNSLEKDIIPAHRLGIKTILFDPCNKYKSKPKEADFAVRDLIEIAGLV